jgi:hypothetical protein
MMMRDEDVAQSVKRHTGGQELSRRAVPAVNDMGNVVD